MGNGCPGPCSKKVRPGPLIAVVQHNLEIKPTEIRDGCCYLYPGVRTADNQNTCPTLTVHTWGKSMVNVKTEGGILQIAGPSSYGGRETTALTHANEKVALKVGVDEQISVIPIEDIISIKIKTEVKKAIEQKKTARQKASTQEELSCCQQVKKTCVKNIFCCCNQEVVPEPEYEVQTTQKQEATRAITVIIKHCRHGLLDTPSNVRVLSKEKQADFYKEHLHVDTTEFYYLRNEVYDKDEYNKQLQESEALARTVMQLKAMNNHYPDEAQLQKIIHQNHLQHFGQKLSEDISILEGKPDVMAATAHFGNQHQLTTA